jgi:hypothetical protein
VGPAPELALVGDVNLDGEVGIADLAALADNYGVTDATWFQADFSGDGLVGIADLASLADGYGAGSASTAPVPEPATLALLASWAAALLRRRRPPSSART